MNPRMFAFAMIVTVMSTMASWGKMFYTIGNSGPGSSWSSSSGGGGGYYGGGYSGGGGGGGGGHK